MSSVNHELSILTSLVAAHDGSLLTRAPAPSSSIKPSDCVIDTLLSGPFGKRFILCCVVVMMVTEHGAISRKQRATLSSLKSGFDDVSLPARRFHAPRNVGWSASWVWM